MRDEVPESLRSRGVRARSLYCDEGSHAELQRRLRRLSAAQRVERVPDLHISLGNPTCRRGEIQSQLRQDLRRFKPVLVILDP